MKGRAALALAPTFGEVRDAQDAYLFPLQLRPLAKEHGRYWSFHHMPTTVALPGNRYAKSLKGFTDHQDEADFRELLSEYASHGVLRPSSYADVFHERYVSPRVPWSVNNLLAPAFTGGWQSALHVGRFTGCYRRYDIRSAYLWAATAGIPLVDTYRRSLNPFRDKVGVFRVQLLAPNPAAPFPFDSAVECLATPEEIQKYELRVSRVIDGVTWTKEHSADRLIEAIKTTSTWKQAARGYWGRWSQAQRIECVAHGKKWFIPNLCLNIPLAHLIVSRVKMRVWEASAGALHVYVDSVITPHELPTGDGLGDWRLEKTYEKGVIVLNPGQYGPIGESLEKMAGVRKDHWERMIA